MLRRPKEEDWVHLIHHMFDSQTRFFFNDEIDMPVDVNLYKQRIEFLEPEKLNYVCFAIENCEGKHVGIANIFNIDERNGTFGDIGIVINPMDRGKGYATAAYRMLGKYMFNERRMHKWNNGYMEENEASAMLHKRLGFEIEGVRKDLIYHDGHYWNLVFCGMTEKQFFEKNYSVFICNTSQDEDKEMAYFRSLDSKLVDGIICISGREDIPTDVISRDIPIVCIDRKPKDHSNAYYVESNHYSGGYKATEELSRRYDAVLVEGAGGLMVPLTRDFLTIDYIAQQNYPLIFVTSGKLGSINHTLLSLEAIRNRNIKLDTVAYNLFPEEEDGTIMKDTEQYIRDYVCENFPDTKFIVIPSVK